MPDAPAESGRRRARRRPRSVAVGVGLGAWLALTGCGAGSPSALDPAGFGARRVAGLWWLLFWIAVVVCAVVIGLLLVAAARRRGPQVSPRPGGQRFVVLAGVAVPALILTVVYGFGLRDMTALQRPSGPEGASVEVIGHLWWWEVHYPGSAAVTANEIHIPVGEVVHVRLTTADVNHSFWVPQLMPKTDLVAGRINETWLKADRPGVFRGQCAEYCGLQHGHMAFAVIAQPGPDFQRWLAAQGADAPGTTTAAADPLVARGRQVFETASCASCHTVRGSTAHARIGPDLTHLADRGTLAAGTVPNTPGYLAGWIANSQAVKPGNRMPPQPLAPDDLRALVAFLDAGGGVPSPGGPATPSGGPR